MAMSEDWGGSSYSENSVINVFFTLRTTPRACRQPPACKSSSRADNRRCWIGPSDQLDQELGDLNHQLTAKSIFARKADEAVRVAMRRSKRTISMMKTKNLLHIATIGKTFFQK